MSPSSSIPEEISPNRYIEKVSLATGEVLDADIRPHQLLVHSHRDYHVVDVQARMLMSRLVSSHDEDHAVRRMKEIRRLGHRASERIARALGKDPERVSKALFGLKDREYYFRYKRPPLSTADYEDVVARLRREAEEQLAAVRRGGRLELRVLLTGGTGFVGKEVLWQAARDDDITEVVVLVRPKTVRDRRSGEVVATLSPAERGEKLLDELWLDDPERRRKIRFIEGDVEQPDLGIAPAELERLATTLTHVVHCAASVAFDDSYEASFRANVDGAVHALELSRRLQSAPGSPFVAHLSIETSYIHGRQVRAVAREDEIVFPKSFYNNYYELTKAMASLETERFMLEHGLRVVQLCPSIVIGESRAGNNRGDTKVVNAPVNVFGRAHQALTGTEGRWIERSKASVIARMACIFPGDPSAELNLIPVDWVARGIRAALRKPRAVGHRVHLATDNRLTSDQIRDIVAEEVGVEVKLAEPTLHRTVTLPVLTKLLTRLKQERLARGLEKLGTIFGGYSEWGQPVHEVGRDVEVLGMPAARPDTQRAFRMLCRHNRYVQEFGKVRDPGEISRRERVWWDFVTGLEEETGTPAGALPASDFHRVVEERLDLDAFVPK